MIDRYFAEYARIEVKQFREILLQHMSNVKKFVAERIHHQRQYDRRVNKRQMQTQESKVDTGKALDVGLVVTERSGTELEVQDESSRLGNDTDADDADIRPVYDEEPMAEIPTGNIFASCTSKVDSEPPHGSNVDISRIHECKQTLDLSAGTSINVQKEQSIVLSAVQASHHTSTEVPTIDMIVMTSIIELESLFGPLLDEYFNGENKVVSKSFDVTTADASDKRQQQLDLTSSTSTLATTVTDDGNFNLYIFLFLSLF
ncbi:hypothetical protein Tco_1419800 [Tanacetum coccineum]